MAEIGIIASIIGLASIGCQLSSSLNDFRCDIASADVDILSISKEVTMFSLILNQVGQTLQAADSVHSSGALETTQQITSECKLVFGEIGEKLDKVTTKKADGSMAPSVQQRFKWHFKKGRVKYLVHRLESLKMDLVVMLQILQIGKLMAGTSNSAPKNEIGSKNDMIARERAQTQNMVIIRCLHMDRLEHLHTVAQYEEAEEQNKQIEHRTNRGADSTQLTIEATQEYSPSSALIKLPNVSLGELDTTLNQLKESPKDMLRISESVIDPLLDRWTRWQEFHDRLETRSPSRYSPTVQNLHKTDDDKPASRDDFYNRGESPRDYHLEGTTTNWRKPHLITAKDEAARPGKNNAGLQPFISVKSSDTEDSHADRRPKKRAPSRYVIDSSSETSDSESELSRQQRRSIAGVVNEERSQYPPQRHSPSQSYAKGSGKRGSVDVRSNTSPNSTPNSTPRSSISAPSPGMQRPVTNPVQGQYQHGYTSPLLPLNTSHAPSPYTPNPYTPNPYTPNPYTPNPYTPHSPYSPSSNTSPQPPAYQNYNQPQHYPQNYPPRTMAPQGCRMAVPSQPRPGPQDSKAAQSSSRYSGHTIQSRRSVEDLKKDDRSQRKKNLARGALGGGAITGLWEALEGLDL